MHTCRASVNIIAGMSKNEVSSRSRTQVVRGQVRGSNRYAFGHTLGSLSDPSGPGMLAIGSGGSRWLSKASNAASSCSSSE